MNFSMLPKHQRLVSLVFACISCAFALSFGLGTTKPWSEIAWWDIVGEGSIALFSMVWIFFLLLSRPPGKVTNWLVSGLSCFMFSALLDLFDEFTYYHNVAEKLSWFESIPAAFGMLLMSYALYHWHQEQLVLNKQLQRREAKRREHAQVDVITQLYSADYMRNHIDNQLTEAENGFSVVMLDIKNFDAFNRQYGHQQGDRLLREVSELIIMNLRPQDLVCRYAGDRFVLLLPDTQKTNAEELAKQINHSVEALAFKVYQDNPPAYQSMRFAAEYVTGNDQVESILRRVNQRLELSKP